MECDPQTELACDDGKDVTQLAKSAIATLIASMTDLTRKTAPVKGIWTLTEFVMDILTAMVVKMKLAAYANLGSTIAVFKERKALYQRASVLTMAYVVITS